jgi:repressor LexA
MEGLTSRQKEVLSYIQDGQVARGVVPTLREIARQFGFRSVTAAADHVRALRKKGYLLHHPRLARSHGVVVSGWGASAHHSLVNVPLYGTIPAGFAADRHQESERSVSIDLESLGLRGRSQIFALEVRGDSMTGRHIVDGDIAILDRGVTPHPGDVVAALIDRESTLKTLVIEDGRPLLKAENPDYPDLIASEELLIQGVLVALVRKLS